MQIDWNAFAPVSAVLGGALIGIAAVLFALVAGRIAGVSGIVEGLLRPARGEIAWRVAFVGGLVVAPSRGRPETGTGRSDLQGGLGYRRILPGPLAGSAGTGAPQALRFVLAMLAGMAVVDLVPAAKASE